MSNSNRTAPYVHLLIRNTDLVDRVNGLASKSLIDLIKVDVLSYQCSGEESVVIIENVILAQAQKREILYRGRQKKEGGETKARLRERVGGHRRESEG